MTTVGGSKMGASTMTALGGTSMTGGGASPMPSGGGGAGSAGKSIGGGAPMPAGETTSAYFGAPGGARGGGAVSAYFAPK
ncbi:Hypothetical protein SRAE_1000300900 [Strongyloides ratti]|uniref:Uncharacterized protein n=1 Tax=Strongyloides ratti TaxID=34506 RepID=A0A090L4P5_STRRB|nr:Hypothetical protein SRAE_1000300900 [Strongyloides ratti]CEF64756.1 Hypothetical protein SRAE_1000300900 [Strongyloides ratti]